ncbi:MAG: hypothetical protein WB729_21805 [Candidatus Sulfotelmatobacter sp.]
MMMSNQDRAKGHDKDDNEHEHQHQKDWQDLARLASQEKDPEKLMELIRQLNSALENNGKDEGTTSSVPDSLNPPQSDSASGKLAEVA